MNRLPAIVFAFASAVVQAHAQPAPLSLSDLHVTQSQGIATIAGIATNMTGRPLSNAFLTFNLYDQSGTVIGNTMAYVQNLAAGDRWQFAAQTPVAFARAQVSQIQVFPPVAAGR